MEYNTVAFLTIEVEDKNYIKIEENENVILTTEVETSTYIV